MMEYDIHTVLDFLTLIATVWVIYTLRIPLKDTYQEEQDSVQTYFVVRNFSTLQVVVISQMRKPSWACPKLQDIRWNVILQRTCIRTFAVWDVV